MKFNFRPGDIVQFELADFSVIAIVLSPRKLGGMFGVFIVHDFVPPTMAAPKGYNYTNSVRNVEIPPDARRLSGGSKK